jgi:hypothetical protein
MGSMKKIKVGGGGIDADGNFYQETEREVEVPDDWFERLWEEAAKPRPLNDVLMMSPEVAEEFKKAMK